MTGQPPMRSSRAAGVALAVLGGAVGTALIGAALWVALHPAPTVPQQTAIQPAEETQPESLPVLPSAADTGEASGAGSSTPDTGVATVPGEEPRTRTHLAVAYRSGGQVWAAREDGSRAVALGTAYAAYTLSPDGSWLAGVGEASGQSAGRVAVRAMDSVGVHLVGTSVAAESVSWSPTADWFAYTATVGRTTSVRCVSVGGGQDREIVARAASPAVSRDGARVACQLVSSAKAVSLGVYRLDTASSQRVPDSQGAQAYGWGRGGNLYFARSASGGGRWEIWRSAAPYAASERLGSITLSAPGYAIHDLHVSPDGKRLMFASVGDDDYSRIGIFSLVTRRFTMLRTRRDAYPYGWSGDGSRLIFFEGNTYQGESSALLTAKADSSGRKVLVADASR